MHLVRVRYFGVVLLQSQSQPTPFPALDQCLPKCLASCTDGSLASRPHPNKLEETSSAKRGTAEALPLSDTFVAAQTFSLDKLFVTRLAVQLYGESHTQTIGLCRQAVQRSSVDRRHADLRRFRSGRFEARQPPVVAWVPLHLMPNDASHRQFRRVHPDGDWARHPADSGHQWRSVDFCCVSLPHEV